jgi:beta-lactam-binding protein with PASTA domain
VAIGAYVNITVSIGGVTIPSLIGLSPADASSLLTSGGLFPDASPQFACIDPGEVIGQDDAGTLVAPGATVHFTWDSGTRKTCDIIK